MLEAELPPKFNDLMAIVFLIIDQLCVMCQDEETTRREGFTASTFLFYFGLQGHLDVENWTELGPLTQRVGELMSTKVREKGGLVIKSRDRLYGVAPRFAPIAHFASSHSTPEAPEDFLSDVGMWGSGRKVAMELDIDPKFQQKCCTSSVVSNTNEAPTIVGELLLSSKIDVLISSIFLVK